MEIEQKVNNFLNNYPFLKKIIKRLYQGVNVLIHKQRLYGNIKRLTPSDDFEYFFGYYDKSPESKDGKFYLSLRVKNTTTEVAPAENAEVVLIDAKNNENIFIIGKTKTRNIQQGCMLQWLGPDYNTKVIYNDFQDNNYCSVIYDINNGTEKIIDFPVYSVSHNGRFALTLDFSRLNTFRPGYGYSNKEDFTKNAKIPNGACIKYVDLIENKCQDVLNYTDLVNFEHRNDMEGCFHKVNHIMISPDDKRFMVLHRWLKGGNKKSRLLTIDIDGKNIFNLLDDDMVSHCFWKNNNEIISFAKHNRYGNGYYLLTDKSHKIKKIFNHLTSDGHPSYNHKHDLFVTDTYPNRNRVLTLRILSSEKSYVISKVNAPFKYDNEFRCDLHPRWNYSNDSIIFDSVHEGKRNMYKLKVGENILDNSHVVNNSVDRNKIKLLFLMTSCKNCGPTWQTLNIIKYLDRDKFEITLVTIYEEDSTSIINEYYKHIDQHYFIDVNKKQILLKKIDGYVDIINKISPDIVHSVGVFPNYLATSLDSYKNIFTLRNYMYIDFIQKFGKVRGYILSYLQINSVKKANKVVVCSDSLKKIYYKKLGLSFDSIQNGVDLDRFNNSGVKNINIKDLNNEELIFIYTGQLIKRKNLEFMIDGFLKAFNNNNKLIILGDGPLRAFLEKKYEEKDNIIFEGKVDNVKEYLKTSDILISASLSEGLPNSVIEGMAMKLPVILSDIEQHKEILSTEPIGGVLFSVTNIDDYIKILKNIKNVDLDEMSKNAYKTVYSHFNAKRMSNKYQEMYINILNKGNHVL